MRFVSSTWLCSTNVKNIETKNRQRQKEWAWESERGGENVGWVWAPQLLLRRKMYPFQFRVGTDRSWHTAGRQCSWDGHGIWLNDCECIPSKFYSIHVLGESNSIDRHSLWTQDAHRPFDWWWTCGIGFLKLNIRIGVYVIDCVNVCFAFSHFFSNCMKLENFPEWGKQKAKKKMKIK